MSFNRSVPCIGAPKRRMISAASAAAAPLALAAILAAPAAFGQTCPETQLQNYTGGGSSICPCFVAGEEAGGIFTAPPGDYPIEILRVGIAWASQFGTSGQTIEDAINIRSGGLPSPGPLIFTLPGPVLQDGAINEWNLEPLAGQIVVNSGAFTVTLKFMIDNSGDYFAASMMTDSGCQSGKNAIYAIPGGWMNACQAGLGGDWVVYVVYRPTCQSGVGEETLVAGGAPLFLAPPSPSPFSSTTRIDFFLAAPQPVTLDVFDISGARVAQLASREYSAGRQSVEWNGRNDSGAAVKSGIYFVKMSAGAWRSTRKVIVSR